MKGYLGINIFVGWFGQDYGIDKYAYSTVGLAAGAAILKIKLLSIKAQKIQSSKPC